MKAKLLSSASSTLIALLAVVQLGSAADGPSASGTWKWSTAGRNGQTRESTLVLKQHGEKLTGALQGQRGETAIAEGKVEGDKISFKITRETQRGTSVASYKGSLEGDAIKGTISVKAGERENQRDWAAKRESLDPTGDWAWVMKRDNGDAWEATMHLKRDGESVSGSFEREGGDSKIELRNGKLSGSTLTFEVVMEADGQSNTIKNMATITGKMMKGKSSGTRDGQAFTHEWEATKK